MLSDRELLTLFETEPERAWTLFIDKHADCIFTTLRRLGFDYDETMDRFVYVCDKLTEDGFRRLRGVRHLGRDGEITPWLIQVVHNLAINWAVSKEGRRRLLKPIAELGELDQAVFARYFWHGLKPSEVCERMRAEERVEIDLAGVLDSLDRIFERLSAAKIWRLISHLIRRRHAAPIAAGREDTVPEEALAARRPSPEEDLLRGEEERRMQAALLALPAQDRLLLLLRYEDGLPLKDAARRLGLDEETARGALKTARRRLKRRLSQDAGLPD